MHLSVILPCHNEEGNISSAIWDVKHWIDSKKMAGTIIVVNDGSKDASKKIVEDLQKQIPELQLVHRPKNGGYGIAVRDGCDAATTEWIAFMDSDGQFKAADFNLLLPFTDSYSFVTGRRAHRADSFVRNTFGKILGGMNLLVLGLWVRDVNCGMKMFTKETWTVVRPTYGVEKLFNTEIFLRLKKHGIPWKTVNVPHYPRTIGTPTGGSLRVIARMFKELWDLRMKSGNI